MTATAVATPPCPLIGWRDKPVDTNRCGHCSGWGAILLADAGAVLETCARCMGKGHR